MHAMGNVIDMRRFSGLRSVLPTTHWTFLCGAGALAGLPLLSGFWSKDDILGVAMTAGEHRGIYLLCFAIGLVTAGLTAFYTFRAYFLTFWGEVRIPSEAGHHAHESPAVMTIPLQILAVGAVALGIVIEPFTHWFSGILEHHWLSHAFSNWRPLVPEHHGFHIALMVGSSLVAIGGVCVAWWMYVREPGVAGRLAQNIQGLYQLSLNKFHVDELYYALIVKPAQAFAVLCRVFDTYVIDSLVDLVGLLPGRVGQMVRPIQNGLVQFYALAMMLGLTVFLAALVLRLGR
jgi:NADH-quinone oxidoreductase subunit L